MNIQLFGKNFLGVQRVSMASSCPIDDNASTNSMLLVVSGWVRAMFDKNLLK